MQKYTHSQTRRDWKEMHQDICSISLKVVDLYIILLFYIFWHSKFSIISRLVWGQCSSIKLVLKGVSLLPYFSLQASLEHPLAKPSRNQACFWYIWPQIYHSNIQRNLRLPTVHVGKGLWNISQYYHWDKPFPKMKFFELAAV